MVFYKKIKSKQRFIISIIVTLLIILLLFKWIDIGDLAKAVKNLSLPSMIIAIVAYLFIYFFRALRFKVLLKNKLKLRELFDIVCIHNLFNQLIPMRVGEISYVYMIKKSKKASTKDAIMSLLIARLYDLITTVLSLLMSFLFIAKIPESVLKSTWVIVFLVLLLILFIFIIIKQKIRVQNIIFKIVIFLKTKKLLPGAIANKLTKKKDIFGFKISKTDNLFITLYSVLIWAADYLFFWMVFRQIIPGISFWVIVVGGSLLNFGTLLLMQGVAGFGTTEGIWSVALISLGINETLAISSSFIIHIIQVSLFVTFGIYGILSKTIKTKEKGFALIRDYKND